MQLLKQYNHGNILRNNYWNCVKRVALMIFFLIEPELHTIKKYI